MNDLADFLTAQGPSPLIRAGEHTIPSSAVLERADSIQEIFELLGGYRVVSMDASPATLLALLVVAERRSLQLILGRASANVPAVLDMLQPDIVVHSAERIEKQPGWDISRESSPGIFLLTSGTTGTPKVAHQTLAALLGRVRTGSFDEHCRPRWLLTYETHSFAGLQVVLSAAMSGGLLIAPSDRNPMAFVQTARREDVSHISGTPTFWRALLMAAGDEGLPSLRQITIGGEAVDQPILDRLSHAFPAARISHIYASTEAGSLFAVHDGRAGFPTSQLEQELGGGVMLRVRNGILEVRSPRRMITYASGQPIPLTGDGWLVTGDLVRVEAERVVFCGRQDQIVNIAGLKVSPEEVEAFLLAQPAVDEALVYPMPSPMTGSVLAAQVVLRPGCDPQAALAGLRSACVRDLSRHMVPRRFELVDSIAISSSGKKVHTR